jgi:hypothetical protein
MKWMTVDLVPDNSRNVVLCFFSIVSRTKLQLPLLPSATKFFLHEKLAGE